MNVKKKTLVLSLPMIEKEWKNCTRCQIGKHVRNHVFLDTIPNQEISIATRADIVLIGDGPGMVEDVEGIPFTGPSGKLLRQAIDDADYNCKYCEGTGYDEKEGVACPYCTGNGGIRIALTNLLACRPYEAKKAAPKNRPPTQIEVLNCMPRLIAMLKQLNPATILMMGNEAQSYVSVVREELVKVGRTNTEFVSIKHPDHLFKQNALNYDSLLYKQYTDQIAHYFEHFFNANRLDSMQKEGARAGKPRPKRN